MIKIFALLKKLINRYFFILLLLIVFISYGQILWMQPWQDDNALIFKLVHIEEAAGFLGKGVFGEGPYRYTATPYYIIYSLFGLNIAVFFGLALMFYFLATLSVYFLLKVLVDKNTGRLASLLYATNYVTSDSFIRLFNSVSTSLSVIFLSSLIISYWKFLQVKKLIFFPFAILAFWLACEFAYVRSHYLIGVVVLMEVILSLFPLSIRSFGKSTLRLTPFILIFIWQYIINGDARLAEGINNTNLILSGKFESLFSIFTGFGQLMIPDRLLSLVPILISKLIANPYYQILASNILLFALFNLLVIKFSKQGMFKKLVFFLVGLFWLIISRLMYLKLPPTTPYVTLLVGYLGGLSILAFATVGNSLKNSKFKIYFLFLALAILNMLFYILYDPTLFYGVYNSRYLVHSFVGLVGVLAIIGIQFKKRVVLGLILGWGVINLFTNLINQQEIIAQRSLPIYNFHTQLKQYIGKLPKNAVLYFDLQDNPVVKKKYSDAITSSQMPETTAIAWRFGLDRYDFKIANNFDSLVKLTKEEQIATDKIYSFWYTEDGLHNTTLKLRNYLTDVSRIETMPIDLPVSSKNISQQEEIILGLKKEISLITPIELHLTIQASLPDLKLLKFPFYRQGVDQAVVVFPTDHRNLALKYGLYKNLVSKRAIYTASDSWQNRVADNLHDSNYETIWQADRVIWQKNSPNLTVDLKDLTEINRIVWVNGFADNTPTEYEILGSKNGEEWFELKKVRENRRADNGELKIIEFEPKLVRFVRMVFLKTLNNDSPAIAELWPVPQDYAKLDLYRTEYFIKDPFGFIPDPSHFEEELRTLNQQGTLQVYWLSDKSEKWLTKPNTKINIVYDGKAHQYRVLIPAGGTQLKGIMLSNIQIPGDVMLVAADEKRVELKFENLH